MPAQPKNAEQPTRHRRRLGNYSAIYLDIIDLVLKIGAIGLATGEREPHDKHWLVESCPSREGES